MSGIGNATSSDFDELTRRMALARSIARTTHHSAHSFTLESSRGIGANDTWIAAHALAWSDRCH